MSKEYNILLESFNQIKKELPFEPDLAIVLGSGLGNFLTDKNIVKRIYYKDINNFPYSTIVGHEGCFVFFEYENKKIVCMSGRVHMYEGYSSIEVVRPIRLMKMMGAKILLLSNASGSTNLDYAPGDIVLINDIISQFVKSPLIGENLEEFGTRFPDMSEIFDKTLNENLLNIAKNNNIKLNKAVYLQTTGPNYETASDIKMFKLLGADCVGMSTGVEAIAARHMGMKTVCLSLITNYACGLKNQILTHEEVTTTAKLSEEKFQNLINEFIKSL